MISQNNSNSESFCVNFESKKSKNANEANETNETIKANSVEFSKISNVDFDAKIEKKKRIIVLFEKKCNRQNYIEFMQKIYFDWSLNYLKANFSRHVNNHSNMFDFEYWFWHCWKCCKKFSTSLNNLTFESSRMNSK